MSHQQSQEDNQPEWQQPNRQVVLPPQAMPAICQVIGVLTYITYEIMIDCITVHYNHIPYYTSILSEEAWVHELLAGHPERMQKELGVTVGISQYNPIQLLSTNQSDCSI
jgi:hypothetical protein